MKACLVKVSPMNTTSGATTDIYIASHDDRRITGLNGQRWIPTLIKPPTIGISLWNGDFANAIDPGRAVLPLNMHVLGQFYTGANALHWPGAAVEIYVGEPGEAWPWTLFFKGRVSSFQDENVTKTLEATVDAEPLNKDILTATYAGTGDAEGGDDLKNRLKPLVIGQAKNVEPLLINAVDNIYQFSGYGPIGGIDTLYERGSAFSAAIANYASYAALLAADVPAGRWATCNAEGLVKLGAPAAGVITGDVQGHVFSSVSVRIIDDVIEALADIAGVDSGLLDSASLAAMRTGSGSATLAFELKDQASFFDLARDIALMVNWQAGASLTGVLFFAEPDIGAGASVTLDAQGRAVPQVISRAELGTSPPYHRTVIGHSRAWRVHSTDEIAYGADLVDRGRYDNATMYREGNIVDLADLSRWVYINPTPTAGNAPPSWPTTSNAYWDNLSPPAEVGADVRATIRGGIIDNPRTTGNVARNLLEATDAGASATISVARHDWDYPNDDAVVTRELGTITGLSFATKYHVYFDDVSMADGAPIYYATTSYATARNSTTNGGRHYLGDITTPADGGAPTWSPGMYGGPDYGVGVLNSFVAQSNLSNDAAPDASGSITGVTKVRSNPDGSEIWKATVNFPATTVPGDANNINGFMRGIYAAATNAAYTMLGPDTAGEDWRGIFTVDTTRSDWTFEIYLKDPTRWYTIAFLPARPVNKDIDPAGVIYGDVIQYGPFRPSATQDADTSLFRIGTTPGSTVVQGASRANAAIDSSNAIATTTKIGGSGGLAASSVSDGASRANSGLLVGGQVATGKAVTDSLVLGTVTDVVTGSFTTDVDLTTASVWYSVFNNIYINVENANSILIVEFLGQAVFGTNAGSSAGTVNINLQVKENTTLLTTPPQMTLSRYFPAAGLSEQAPLAFQWVFPSVAVGAYDIDVDARRQGTASSGFAYIDWKSIKIIELKR